MRCCMPLPLMPLARPQVFVLAAAFCAAELAAAAPASLREGVVQPLVLTPVGNSSCLNANQ